MSYDWKELLDIRTAIIHPIVEEYFFFNESALWCKDNNLSLNVIKTKEMIVDYSKRRTEHDLILIDRAVVEQVESFKFLGVHITNKLTWSKH